MRFSSIVLGLAAFLVAPNVRAAPLPPVREERPPFWATTWGIASPDGKTAYLTGAEGKVEAIDLKTGALVWTFADPGKPLALIGRRLAVEVAMKDKPNTVRIVLLNNKGMQVGQSDPVELPERMNALRGGFGPGSGPASRLAPATNAWSDGIHLYLTWSSRGTGGPGGRGGGRRGGPGGGGGPGGPAGGGPGGRGTAANTLVAKIQLRTGKVEKLDPEDAPSPPRPKLPTEIARAGRGARGGAGRPGGLGPRIGINGKYAVSVTVSRDEDTRQVILKRWDLASGKALKPIVLTKEGIVDAVLSADHRSVLVNLREPAADPDEAATFWRVYSTLTGDPLCAFSEQDGSSNVTALGDRVLIVIRKPITDTLRSAARPRVLRALDITSGNVLWERPIEPLRAVPRSVEEP